MAFIKVSKGASGSRMDEIVEIRMGSHRNETGRTIYLTMTNKVVEQVGWKITDTSDTRASVRIAIQEGVGEDAGFWQIVEDAEVGYACGREKHRSHAFAVNLQCSRLRHYVLNDDAVNAHAVEFTIDPKEKTILVQCPDWLRYNPQSYKEPSKQQRTPPPEEKPKPRPTLSVVDDDTGDDLRLNRRQRRVAAQALTRAMR